MIFSPILKFRSDFFSLKNIIKQYCCTSQGVITYNSATQLKTCCLFQIMHVSGQLEITRKSKEEKTSLFYFFHQKAVIVYVAVMCNTEGSFFFLSVCFIK